jgi:SAM-dependent methyltransferase
MQHDVADLMEFYRTPLGHVARRLLSQQIRARWRGLTGGTLMGLGFSTPYLAPFRSEVTRLGALMPDTQGALVWPRTGPALTVLVEEDRLPLPDNSVDRLICVHGLEVAGRPEAVLREIWRVLAPEGRLLLIVPNRRGVWARLDTTPFGQGRPYSRSQLEHLLIQSLFRPVGWDGALYFPPFDRRVLVRSATVWERIGRRLTTRIAGVILVEAKKELMAPIGKAAKARALRELVTVRREPEDVEAKSAVRATAALLSRATGTGS